MTKPLLIDTCALLWLASNPDRISSDIRRQIAESEVSSKADLWSASAPRRRGPGSPPSSRVISRQIVISYRLVATRSRSSRGGFTTLSACNIVYALRKQLGSEQTIEAIRRLVRIIEPIGTSVTSLLQSLEDPKTDFEDTVQSKCAFEWNADSIITRDKSGFANCTIPVLTPSDFLLRFL